jgi:HSP20 family protein
VTGEKRTEHEETGKSYFFSEREYGAFQRAFRLPPDVDADKINAELKNGVLRLWLPKKRAAEGGPSRKVEIKTG